MSFTGIAVLNVKSKTIQFLEGNKGQYLLDLGWSRQIFL